MSDLDEKKMGPRWSQLESIIRGIQTIFRWYAPDLEKFGLSQLYRIGCTRAGTFIQSGDANDPHGLRIKIVECIKFFEKNGQDLFTVNHILKELSNTRDSIIDYDGWRMTLPDHERDTHVQFDLDGLDELLKATKWPMTQITPPIHRKYPRIPNALPVCLSELSVNRLLQIAHDRNIHVSPVMEEEIHDLIQRIADNSEHIY